MRKPLNLSFLILFPIVFSFIFTDCSKKEPEVFTDGQINLADANPEEYNSDEPTQTWHETNRKICVLYGYGYNSEEFIQETNGRLYKNFGSAENGGLIYSLVFPDDFKRGSRTYITNLTELLNGKEIQGIVLLGAPEGTHVAIARMQDSWGGNLPYPVFTLFPQDDVLGIEDSSDFVLDKAQKAEINGILAEEEQTYVQEIPEILENCVKIISYSDSSFEKNAGLFEIVKNICGKLNVTRYSDTDTGLISINHFVLE